MDKEKRKKSEAERLKDQELDQIAGGWTKNYEECTFCGARFNNSEDYLRHLPQCPKYGQLPDPGSNNRPFL